MKLLVIHLSDLHIHGAGDFILQRAAKVADAAMGLDDGIAACVVAVTGDIAFSGKTEEYVLAEQFFRELAERLKAVIQLADIHFAFAPGNHDCDFSGNHQVRDILIASLAKNQTTEVGLSLVEQCCVVQEAYRKFVDRFAPVASPSGAANAMYSSKEVRVGDQSTVLRTYNTAWTSRLEEAQGELLYPPDYCPPEDDPSALVVALFHHPYNWLESNNGRLFRRHIEHSADLILTGHEHDASQYSKTNRAAGTANEYCEGAVLQDSKTGESGFNIVLVDLEARTQKFLTCRWDGRLYDAKAHLATWQDLQRNRNRVRNEFVPSAAHTDFLTNPGAGYTHSRKERLELDDIFVEPNLRELIRVDAKGQIIPPNVSGDAFWSRLLDAPFVTILGDEASGKTTLCKRLFGRFHAAGFVPLVLRGEEITSCDWDRLQRIISATVADQYSATVVEKFRQLDREKRVLLIDNYHLLALNRKGCVALLECLRNHFGRIVLFADSLAKVEELTYESTGESPVAAFTQFEILEFGHVLREELIERWLTIGQEFTVPDEQLDLQVIQTKRIVDAIIGKNYLPSHPIYILIVLQQIEAQTDLNTSSGALGYLYEALITSALSKIGRRIALDTAYTYLSEVAHRIFSLKVRRLTVAQLEALHKEYCAEYKVALRFEVIQKALVDAGVLVEDCGECAFKFKYYYYYFAARHLRDRLTSPSGREQLRELSTHIYKEEFANILVFLTYLSRDPVIIEEMRRAAAEVYPNVDPCDLTAHTKFVTSLNDDSPKHVLVDKKAKDGRKELNETRDEFNARFPASEDRDLDDALRINVAFKTIQILGQILKNFPGSLRGPTKFEIARECYFLGLRTMQALLNIIEQGRDVIVEHLVENVLHTDTGDRASKERKARQIVSRIVEMFGFAIVKKVAGSVGSEALAQTYAEVLEKHDSMEVRLIDLAVKLDHFQRFPDEEFSALIGAAESNLLPILILRHLALDHFYRFPVPRKIKQSYCSRLGIEFRTVTLLEQKRMKS